LEEGAGKRCSECDIYCQADCFACYCFRYILTVSEEEREFPLAFSVIVYKDTEQFERLIRAVYRPHNAYCIHLDIKTPPLVLEQVG